MSTRLTHPANSSAVAPLTALVADDFEAARGLFVDALTASGRFIVVAEAANGREALVAVADRRPDLAVLDLAMPQVGGLDVIEEINDVSPQTRIVVVSGFPGRGLEQLVVARGAAGYVRKGPSIRAVVGEIVVAAGALEIAERVMAETRQFPQDERTPRDARRFVDELLQMWDCQPAIDSLQLILSEVVSNAVVHARSAPEVSVRLLDGFLRVEVADDSESMPELRTADALATGGRGMQILDAEATRWGVAARPGGGKSVWFEVPIFGSDWAGTGGTMRPGGAT